MHIRQGHHLRVAPLELDYSARQVGTLSCVVKKLSASNGRIIQKKEIPAEHDNKGKAIFPSGARFDLSTSFDPSDTKIALHFMNRKEHRINCIGSTQFNLGGLPLHPSSTVSRRLENCLDPRGRVRVEVGLGRSENNIMMTEGMRREMQMERSRRTHPTIPTAYEISRNNYAETVAVATPQPERPQQQSKRQVAQELRQLLQKVQTGATLNHSKVQHTPSMPVTSPPQQRSPKPRRNTPQPIPISPVRHTAKSTRQATQAITKTRPAPPQNKGRHDMTVNLTHRSQESPPVQYESSYNEEDHPIDDKYREIAEKLQAVHESIIHKQEKTRPNPSHPISLAHSQDHLEQLHGFSQSATRTHEKRDYLRIDDAEARFGPIQTPTNPPSQEWTPEESHQYQSPINASPLKKRVEELQKEVENQHEVILRHQAERKVSQGQIVELMNRISQLTQKEIQWQSQKGHLMEELQNQRVSTSEVSRQIKDMNQEMEAKQSLLCKMTDSYESELEKNYSLKQTCQQFKSQIQDLQSHLTEITEDRDNSQEASLRSELQEMQRQLKMKENQLTMLRAESEKLRNSNDALAQELRATFNEQHQQIIRQRSLALLDQPSHNAIHQQALHDNQQLKAEVRLLRERLQALNSLMAPLVEGQSPSVPRGQSKSLQQMQLRLEEAEASREQAESNCKFYAEELKAKKTIMAEMIQMIWNHGQGHLMNDMDTLLTRGTDLTNQ